MTAPVRADGDNAGWSSCQCPDGESSQVALEREMVEPFPATKAPPNRSRVWLIGSYAVAGAARGGGES